MEPLFRFFDHDGNVSNWINHSAGWEIEKTQKVLLMAHGDETSPLAFRIFGYERYKPGKRVVRSVRPYIVRYVVGGRGRFNGKPLQRGDCYLSVPGQKYVIESDVDEPLVHYWFELIGSKAPLYVERIFGAAQPCIIRLTGIEHYEATFSSLLFCDLTSRKLSTYLYSVFFDLLSLHQNEQEEASAISSPMMMYLEAVEYIESHLNRQIKVTDLCERLHIVPDYLYKIFKRYSGMSTQEYIANSKMHVAAILLASHEHSIADIADMVGYADQGQLTKAFRRVYGMTPSAYRHDTLQNQKTKESE